MKIIRSILLLAVGFGTLPAQAQLTIDACQQKAQANYPLVAQYGLIRQSEQYDLENANKGYLPQLSLSAKASYQTDVTKIPFSLPGIDIPTLSKDQYQVVAEVNQVIWDGGNIRAKKLLIVIGPQSVVNYMITNNTTKKRNTGLKYKLRNIK